MRKGNYKLILKNDDENSFEDVIFILKQFCYLDNQQSTQCAVLTHETGQSTVKEGTKKDLELLGKSLQVNGLNVEVIKK